VALVLVVAVLGLAVGLLAGGRLGALGALPIRLGPALPVGLGVQVAALLLEPWSRVLAALGYALAAALVATFAAANLTLPGVPLMGLGLVLNAVVVLANGVAMPVSVAAAARAGISHEDLRLEDDPLHIEATDGTRLRALGDSIAVPLPVRPQVVSPGDVLLAAGVGLFLCIGTLRPRRQDRVAQPPSREARSSTRASDSTTRGSYS
jgi:hypothetical protein